jgi:hypothetical protein
VAIENILLFSWAFNSLLSAVIFVCLSHSGSANKHN